jgi:hypothetical protein
MIKTDRILHPGDTGKGQHAFRGKTDYSRIRIPVTLSAPT